MKYGSRSYESRDDKASCQLSEKETKKVTVTAEIFGMTISSILLYEFIKLITRYILDNLGRYKLALIHNPDMLKLQDQ
jgi:hypothetical protein